MIRCIPVESRRQLRWQLIWFLIWFLVTCFAVYLQPRSIGHGTHTELGFPPCLCVVLFGRPCPACGLTTSFTATVHGDFALAFQAHPLGPLLYGLLTFGGIASIISFVRKIRIDTSTRPFARFSCIAVFVFMAFGIARFVLSPHYGDHDPFHQLYVARR